MSPECDAYEALLEHLAAREPVNGWQHVQDVPHLSDAQLAICLRAHSDVLDDIMVNADDLADCLDDLPIAGGQEAHAYAGNSILQQMVTALRKQLLSDLQDHAEDAEIETQRREATRCAVLTSTYIESQYGAEAP